MGDCTQLAAVLSAEETACFLHFGFSDADVAAATQIEMQHKHQHHHQHHRPTEADSPSELTEAEVAWLERPVTPPAPRRPETSTAALHRALSGYANPDAPLVWSPNRTPAELQRELRMEMDGPSCCLREARAAAAATDRSPAWLASPVIDLTESPEDAAFWVDLAASAGAHLPFIKQEKENQPDNQQKPPYKGR